MVDGEQSDQVDAARVLALATLEGMTPARLSALIEGRTVDDAWNEVIAGRAAGGPAGHLLVPRPSELAAAWCRATGRLDPAELWRVHREAGVLVALPGSVHYPAALVDDLSRPAVLFLRGDAASLDGPRVAVVGTRDCTRYGRDLAFELGRDLASEGIRVVSGLALGIDSAAHAGALDADAAPPVGVVGSGLDVVYPRRNASLWRAVGERGVLLTEHPLGRSPTAWHFPARNRIIAAIADVVVVVESHARGGALNTADHAIERDTQVMAVPGSVRSEASIGSNRLLDVAHVCQGVDDVLTLLGLDTGARRRGDEGRQPPSGDDAAVLDALEWEPTSLETLMLRTGSTLGQLSSALERLERAGWVARRGSWSERRAAGS